MRHRARSMYIPPSAVTDTARAPRLQAGEAGRNLDVFDQLQQYGRPVSSEL